MLCSMTVVHWGFEVKHHGKLQLIKPKSSRSSYTLQECYAAVTPVADQWLNILYTKAETPSNKELVDLIAENYSIVQDPC